MKFTAKTLKEYKVLNSNLNLARESLMIAYNEGDSNKIELAELNQKKCAGLLMDKEKILFSRDVHGLSLNMRMHILRAKEENILMRIF